MQEDLLSLSDVCQVLGVDHVQVYTWMSTKKLPALLVNGTWKFERQAIDQWKVNAELPAMTTAEP